MPFDILMTSTVLLLLALVLPTLAIRDHRIFLERTKNGDPDARAASYRGFLVTLWGLTVALMAWWLAEGHGFERLGLVPAAEGWQWLAIATGIAIIVAQVNYVAWISGNQSELLSIHQRMGDLMAMAPQSTRERRLFDAVSISAGICEEILYRGILLALLSALVGTWPAVVLSSLIFGLGHAYQGSMGIAKTTGVGLMLAVLTVTSGSLFIAMALHTAIDLTSARVLSRAQREVRAA